MTDLILIDPVSGDVAFNINSDPVIVRTQIMALKDRLMAQPGEHIEMMVEHTVLDGMYMRKLFIPKGSIVVGKIHRKACLNVVAMGDISVMTETGYARVQAGFTLSSPVGLQKVGFAHEDTIFINVFRTDETDIDKIEAEIACESYEALAGPVIENMEALCR